MLYRRTGRGLARSAQFEESIGCRCRSRRWPRNRSDSHAPDCRRFGGKPDALCAGFGRTRQRHPYRRMAGICSLEEQRLRARGHVSQRKEEDSIGVDAAGSPRDLPAETMAAGNPPRCSQPQAPRLVSRRVHLPLQPTAIQESRQALLSPRSAGCHRRSCHLLRARSPTLKKIQTTICRGYLSERHTHLEQITIGMPEETAAQILSRENIACGLSVRQEHTCWFSDFWRDYEIVADSKTGTVSRLSYVRQRRRPILRRIF